MASSLVPASDGVPFVTARSGQLLPNCSQAPVAQFGGVHMVYLCRINGWPSRAGYPTPGDGAAVGFTQYSAELTNKCSLIALAWASLVADGADPGASEAIYGAFGYAALGDYPEEPPSIETLVGTRGLFNASYATVINFLLADGSLVLGRLFEGPGGHLTVSVLTTAGTSIGLAVLERSG